MEAEKEAHVRDAIRGLRTIFASKGVKLVPLVEMVDAITVNQKEKKEVGRSCPRDKISPHLFVVLRSKSYIK